jgi:hypothetical protein
MVLKSVCNKRSVDVSKNNNGNKSDGGKLSLDELLMNHIVYPGPSLTGASFYPWNPNNFLSHHNDGRLLHESRFGITSPPASFHQMMEGMMDSSSSSSSSSSSAKVTSVDFSKFIDGIFLVGYDDGSVRLFHHTSSEPRACWEGHCFADRDTKKNSNGGGNKSVSGSKKHLAIDLLDHRSIVKVQWSLHRPCVFYVMDSDCCLHVFDLVKSETMPYLSERIVGGSSSSSSTAKSKSKSGESKEDIAMPFQSSSSSYLNNPHGCHFSLSQFASTSSLIAVNIDGSLKFRPVISSLSIPIDNEVSVMQQLLDHML